MNTPRDDSLQVASYILQEEEQMPIFKLHKLLYYCQAWHLVWQKERLFAEKIFTLPHTPYLKSLDKMDHHNPYQIIKEEMYMDPALTVGALKTVGNILRTYGKLSNYQIQQIVCQEDPFVDARQGLPNKDVSTEREISVMQMQKYYSSMETDPDAEFIEDLEWPY